MYVCKYPQLCGESVVTRGMSSWNDIAYPSNKIDILEILWLYYVQFITEIHFHNSLLSVNNLAYILKMKNY